MEKRVDGGERGNEHANNGGDYFPTPLLQVEMEECVALIMNELRSRGVQNPYTLAYQSRVGPVEWLKPYTDDTIKRLGEESDAAQGLLAVPISFVSEHIETLEEIDMEYRELALESGKIERKNHPSIHLSEFA